MSGYRLPSLTPDRLDRLLIYFLCAFDRERRSRRQIPEVYGLGAFAACSALDAVRFNCLLGFAAGEICLRMDGTLSRQIQTLLGGFRVADNHESGLGLVLQAKGNLIQYG